MPKGESSALNYNRDNLNAPYDVLVDAVRLVRIGAFRADFPRGARKVDARTARTRAVGQMEERVGSSFVSLASLFAGRAVAPEEVDCWYMPPAGGTSSGRSSSGSSSSSSGASSSDGAESGDGSASEDEGSVSLSEVPTAFSEGEAALEVAVDVLEEGRLDQVRGGAAESPGYFRHARRLTVHVAAEEGASTLKCGRDITSNFVPISAEAGPAAFPRCLTCFGQSGI